MIGQIYQAAEKGPSTSLRSIASLQRTTKVRLRSPVLSEAEGSIFRAPRSGSLFDQPVSRVFALNAIMIFPTPLRRLFFVGLLVGIFVLTIASAASAQKISFPVSPQLTGAVEFWKQIFVTFSSKEAVFFDPMDPGKIYSVVRVPETDEGRAIIEKERARIIADYDLTEEDGRVRSQRGAKELFLSGLKISGRYVSQMQNIFRAEGLPAELAYLPLVESSFNIRARSPVGAVGMWQFMLDTGKKFLRIDDAVDERMDPMASTRAAARLLKQNYRLFGNWPLAITAYNHGTEGIFQGINTVGSQNLEDLIRRYQSPTFGFASKNFYAEFVAAAEIAKNSEAYFPFFRALRPVVFREVAINRPVRMESLLKPAAISQNDFFDWNPALSPATKYLPAGYRVKVPPEKAASFLAAHQRLAEPPEKKGSPVAKRRNAVQSGRRVESEKMAGKRKKSNRSPITRSADRRTAEQRIGTEKGQRG